MDLSAQQNISQPISVRLDKRSIPPVLEFVEGSLQFMDADTNNVIDANEQCKIRFQIANTGRGDGYGCEVRVTATGKTQGLSYGNLKLPTIPSGEKLWVEIPVRSSLETVTGDVTFTINVVEPQGYGIPETITTKIGTHKLKVPDVQIASYKIGDDQNATLQRRKPFVLQLAVQNMDQGVAKDVRVNLSLPANVNWTGGDNQTVTIPVLKAGETKYIEYELMANQNAAENIELKLALSESQGKFARGRNIPLTFGQHIGGTVGFNVERKDKEVEIERVSLVSDVDENIPETDVQDKRTFAVIIANEQYRKVAAVPFAQNDGGMFREYCLKTLGIPENQINYIPNATGNDIKEAINWLQMITNNFPDTKVIFYYAGHGIPNEQNLTAYLMPTDGSSSDISTCYKLDDLYAALGAMPAAGITVLLDACFSGVKRDGETFAAAAGFRGVAVKVQSGVPHGRTVVLSAAQGDQTAQPYTAKQHGMFTYFLLKKLQETKGDVSLQTLSDYICTSVKQQSILENGKLQEPCVIPSRQVSEDWQNWKLK